MLKNINKFFLLLVVLFVNQLFAQNEVSLIMDTSGYKEGAKNRVTNSNTVVQDTIASIKGEAIVNNDGGLVYRLPIEVLPSVNDFSPNIGLVYNSQAGNGVAGWGWNIDGLSIISIGSQTKEVDGLYRGIKYDGKDPYYLDGARLISTDGKNFTTLLYSKIEIEKFTTGDYSFVVRYPNGKVAKYKELTPGNHYISVIIDSFNNSVNYEYNISGGRSSYTTFSDRTPYEPGKGGYGDKGKQSIYLTEISYGSPVGETPKSFVLFNYKNTKVTQSKYVRGERIEHNRVLSEVVISDYGNKNSVYKKYTLYHDYIQQDRIERLIEVNVENKVGDRLKPLTFSYTGKGDSVKMTQSIQSFITNETIRGLGEATLGDFKGDGTLQPIYEVIHKVDDYHNRTVKHSKLWNPYVGEIESYSYLSKKLFAGKILEEREGNNVISNADALITFLKTNEDTGENYYTLQFFDLSGKVKKDQGTIKFTLPSICNPGARQDYKKGKSSMFHPKLDDKADEYLEEFENQRKFLFGDFNNDGLVDLFVFSPKSEVLFAEIGKFERKGQDIPFYKVQSKTDIKLTSATTIYPVDFDGDKETEFMIVDEAGNLQMLKMDFSNLSINSVDVGIKKLDNFSVSTPIVFGDFNGDGLIDFITPVQSYDLDNILIRDGAFNKKRINADKLLWRTYISDGKGFKADVKDFKTQRLAHIKPYQRNEIKKSSDWDKFWSGTPDVYEYTQYGASTIMAMDVNGDGVSDIVSFKKYGRIIYNESGNLLKANINNDSDNLLNKVFGNGIDVFLVKPTEDGGFDVANTSLIDNDNNKGFNLSNKLISPISLVINKSDFNSLNAYKNGIKIHDILSKTESDFVVNNDSFVEGQLNVIDNNAGSKVIVDYRPLSESNNTDAEKIYTFSDLKLGYPYFVHKANGFHRLVHKLTTQYDDKNLTKEYRYENAVQHLEGKGLMGFQKTRVSDSYESILNEKKQFVLKDPNKGIFWTTNTFDPLLDNVQIKKTYGSLKNTSHFSEATTSYQKIKKDNNRYLIVADSENTKDYLNSFSTSKTYEYDTSNDIFLTQSTTSYFSPSLTGGGTTLTQKTEEAFDYANRINTGVEGGFYYGKIKESSVKTIREGHQFSTKQTYTYTNQGAVSVEKKYGNNTPSALVTEYSYNNFGGLAKKKVYTDGITPAEEKYEYDVTKRFITKITDNDDLVETKTIDTNGLVSSTKDKLGLVTKYQYDSWGNLHTVTDYLGNKTKTKKSTNQLVPGAKYSVSVLGADGSENVSYFDVMDRNIASKVKSLNGKWIFANKEYDIYGNVVRSSQPYFQGESVKWNTTKYDRLNRPIETTDFTGKVAKVCYEKNKVTVEQEHKKTAKWVDATGLVTQTQDQGGVIKNRYYANGSLKEADYEGILTKVEIDGWGNRIKLIDPSAGTYRYEYDNIGRTVKTTNPKGGFTTYEYDLKGRLKSEKTVSPTESTNISIDYTYDATTKLPVKTFGTYNGNNFEYSIAYDNYGRVKSKTEDTPKFKYTNSVLYDKLGRVESSTIQTNVKDNNLTSSTYVSNVYDPVSGMLVEQREHKSKEDKSGKLIWKLTDVMAFGAAQKVIYGNGYTIENKYSKDDLFENIQHSLNGKSIVDIGFTYDAKKGVLQERNNKVFGIKEQFGYDDLDRLLTEKTNGKLVNEYTYDYRGRTTSNTEVGRYNYNETDYQLQSIDFNDKGHELYNNRGFATIKYNSFKSPIEINLEGKGRIDYEFSILKNRYSSYYGSTDAKDKQPIQKYYSSDKAIEIIVDKDKTQLITYVTGDPYSANYIKIEELQAGKSTVKNYYLHRDNQGTIVGISDEAGAVVEQRSFDAWGNLQGVKIQGVDGKIDDLGWNRQLLLDRGYTGHEHLYTVGLIHMNGRVYDPKLRRFLSPDNYVQDNTNTQNYNRYGYVLNNPLLYTDISGEVYGIDMLIAAGIAAAIAVGTTVIMNAINDIPIWYGLGKSATMGAISGAISFGIGSIVQACSLNFIVQAGMHGIVGGAMSELNGGTFISGFAAGAISSLISSGVEFLGKSGGYYLDEDYTQFSSFASRNSTLFKSTMIVSGGLSGGISSSIAGGNFWQGMQQGLITSGLNHSLHLEAYENDDNVYINTKDKTVDVKRTGEGFDTIYVDGEAVACTKPGALGKALRDEGYTVNMIGPQGVGMGLTDLVLDFVNLFTGARNIKMGTNLLSKKSVSNSNIRKVFGASETTLESSVYYWQGPLGKIKMPFRLPTVTGKSTKNFGTFVGRNAAPIGGMQTSMGIYGFYENNMKK